MKRFSIVAALFLVLALTPGLARAHAVLLGTEPPNGAVLGEPVSEIALFFNEMVAPVDVRVLNGAGSVVTGPRDVRARDAEVRVILPPEMPPGAYLVTYRVRSGDAHPVGGSFYFTIGRTAAPPPTAPDTRGVEAMWRTLDWLLRALHFASLVAACGGVLFAVFVEGGAVSRATRRYVLISAGLASVTALIGIGVHGAHLTLTPLDAFFSSRPWLAGAATSLAPAAAIVLGGMALILVAIRRLDRPFLQWIAIAGTAAAASSLSATGHVGAADPAWLATSALGIHVLAVSFWVGSLLPLLRIVTGAPDKATAALGRFSSFVVPSVALLALSGFTVAFLQVRRLDALATTNYGQLLLFKLALVVGLVALAAYNRFRLLGRLSQDRPKTLQTFARTIRTEIAIALVIVAVTAGLGFVTPPRASSLTAGQGHHGRHEHGEQAAGIKAEAISGSHHALLMVTPGRAGINTLEVTIRDSAGKPLKTREVTAAITKDDQGIEAFPRAAEALGNGRYQFAAVPLPYAGKWQVRVDALVTDFEKAIFRFEIDVP